MSGGIVLVGLSGSGKSTVGRELALALALPLFDTDRLVEQTAGCTVAELFSRGGEEHFRALEAQVLAQACHERGVIATGGGAVLRAENRAAMRTGNLVVWLDPPLAQLVERLTTHGRGEARPLLEGDVLARLQHLRDERHRLYAATAHVRFGGDLQALGGSRRVAAMLASMYRNWRAKEVVS